jgi:hypothetical protein
VFTKWLPPVHEVRTDPATAHERVHGSLPESHCIERDNVHLLCPPFAAASQIECHSLQFHHRISEFVLDLRPESLYRLFRLADIFQFPSRLSIEENNDLIILSFVILLAFLVNTRAT